MAAPEGFAQSRPFRRWLRIVESLRAERPLAAGQNCVCLAALSFAGAADHAFRWVNDFCLPGFLCLSEPASRLTIRFDISAFDAARESKI